MLEAGGNTGDFDDDDEGGGLVSNLWKLVMNYWNFTKLHIVLMFESQHGTPLCSLSWSSHIHNRLITFQWCGYTVIEFGCSTILCLGNVSFIWNIYRNLNEYSEDYYLGTSAS